MAPWVNREPRCSLHLPVSAPPLRECWSVNLSANGIGLVAARLPEESGLTEGTEYALSFELPGGQPVQAQARVQWCFETGARSDGLIGCAVGLRLMKIFGEGRLQIDRYLQSYRAHVIVALATEHESTLLLQQLENEVYLHTAATPAEVHELLERGDIAALFIGSAAPAEAMRILDEFAERYLPPAATEGTVTADLAARIIYAAPAEPRYLVNAFNRGVLTAVLAQPLRPHEVHSAIVRASAQHGVRTEQHRSAMALERALYGRQKPALEPVARGTTAPTIVYRSSAMAATLAAARKVAPFKTSVLLQGETGTGKELVARMIHDSSQRAQAPFVVQDCGILTETLLESELFGHVRGAFTGAIATKPGLFMIADGGTVMLDEFQNLSPKLQAELLRVIETGEVRPVGATQPRHVDVRIIAACNVDLSEQVRLGRLRADLYFRLALYPITLAPLRERPDDIEPLVQHFLGMIAASMARPVPELSGEALAALRSFTWPGNVRELRNVLEWALIACRAATIAVDDLPPPLRGQIQPAHSAVRRVTVKAGLRAQVAEFEKQVIAAALARHGGVVRRAARELGVPPVTLARRIERCGGKTKRR
jgi:two-component system, NtrC family, response regulator HupR/HoxA